MKIIVKWINYLMIAFVLVITNGCNTTIENDEFIFLDSRYGLIIEECISKSDTIKIKNTYFGKQLVLIKENSIKSNIKYLYLENIDVDIEKGALSESTIVIVNNDYLDRLDMLKSKFYPNEVKVCVDVNYDGNFLSLIENETITLKDSLYGWRVNGAYYNSYDIIEIGNSDLLIERETKEPEIIITLFDDGKIVDQINTEKLSLLKLPILEKEGYIFLGWFDGDNYISSDYKFQNDLVLNAKWEKLKEIVITLISDSYEEIIINVGDTINLPILEKEGYDFLGWFDGDSYISSDYKFTKDLVLNAKWEKTKAFITLDVNGGEMLDDTYLYCDFNSVIKTKLPIREGYKFMGWSNTKYGAWIDKFTYNNTKYSVGLSDEMLYALWIPNEYSSMCIEDTFENNPWHHIYYINSYEDLVNIKHSGYYFLESNVNCRNKSIKPLRDNCDGDELEPFIGFFDGCGYEIRNLKVVNENHDEYVGLFGVLEGYVCNLSLVNVGVDCLDEDKPSLYSGVLFGMHTKGEVFNVTLNNVSIKSNSNYTGLLGGYSEAAINKTIASGTINSTGAICAGLVGEKTVHNVNNVMLSSVNQVKCSVRFNVSQNTICCGMFGYLYNNVLVSEAFISNDKEINNYYEFGLLVNDCIISNMLIKGCNCLIKEANNNIFRYLCIDINSKDIFEKEDNNDYQNLIVVSDKEVDINEAEVVSSYSDASDIVFEKLSFDRNIWIVNEGLGLRWINEVN